MALLSGAGRLSPPARSLPGPRRRMPVRSPNALPASSVDFVAVQADGTPVRRPAGLRGRDPDRRSRAGRARAAPRRDCARRRPPPASRTDPAPPFGTNDERRVRPQLRPRRRRGVVRAGREQQLRSAVEGLIAHLTPADRLMMVALPFGGVELPFTSQPARIRLAMGRIAGPGQPQRDRIRAGLPHAPLSRIVRSLPAHPAGGRIAAHAGAVHRRHGRAAPRCADGARAWHVRAADQAFRRVAAAAGIARANFYVMQPADIGMSGSAWRATIGGVGDQGSDNPLEGIEHLAGVTGAARLSLDAAGPASLLPVARESSAYYEAEIEPERNDASSGRSRRLAVRVTRRGVTTRSPAGDHVHRATAAGRRSAPDRERHPRVDRQLHRRPAAHRRLHRARRGRPPPRRHCGRSRRMRPRRSPRSAPC